MFHSRDSHQSHTAPSAVFFFFNDTATTEIYTLSLHDALPICARRDQVAGLQGDDAADELDDLRHVEDHVAGRGVLARRSEEHTSELQSRLHLVCRLLLEKKKRSSRATSRLIPSNTMHPNPD